MTESDTADSDATGQDTPSGRYVEEADALSARAAILPDDLASLPWPQALARGRAHLARSYLEEVLRRHGGRVAEAAAHAGVERESFYRLMRRYGVEATDRPTRRISTKKRAP